MDMNKFQWTRQPKSYTVEDGEVRITTLPHTDLWQRTSAVFSDMKLLDCAWKAHDGQQPDKD